MNKEFLDSLKKNPCKDCGKIYPPECMDFDHLENKNRTIASMKNFSKENILKEVSKCELVCAYCHNIRTNSRRNKNTKPTKTKIENKKLLDEIKKSGCYICGYSIIENLEFDHIDRAKKTKNICELAKGKTSLLKEELKNCRVICIVCHRTKSIYETDVLIEKKKKIIRDFEKRIRECIGCHEIKEFCEFPKRGKIVYTRCKKCFYKYRKGKKINGL